MIEVLEEGWEGGVERGGTLNRMGSTSERNSFKK
jgi:hypothetical protein